ncbi:MAG: long-chain fatty acid--CoA ligase [Nannocystaceae bacterium]
MGLNLVTILREGRRVCPTRTAIHHEDTTIDYATLDARSRRLAGALRRLGVGAGEPVALMLPNIPEFVVAYFAGHYAASPIVPLNVTLTVDELVYHLADSGAAALIVWEDRLAEARAALERVPGCRRLIVVEREADDLRLDPGLLRMARLCAEETAVDDAPPTMPDDTAVILYTSGTTGQPKGAELTHFNLFYNADCFSRSLMGLDREVALCSLPLFHSFGQGCVMNATLATLGTLVLQTRFDARSAIQLIQRHGVTFFCGVPTMYVAMLWLPGDHDLRGLRYCVSGGAPLPVEVLHAFEARTGARILEGYGLSETSPAASFTVLDGPRKPGSIGVPLRGLEFRLVADDGQVIDGADVAGEIWVKGHAVMKGYRGRPDETAAVLSDGWLRTGDIGTRDADGYYYVVDRKKDMINRGGYKIYPREVEEVLYRHPSIAQAAVFGVPDPVYGEEVKAVIVREPGAPLLEWEVSNHCREALAPYKIPRVVEFVDALPLGPTGKVLKRALVDQRP